jgi:hypothetical protein
MRPEFTIMVMKKYHAYKVRSLNFLLSFDKGYAVKTHRAVFMDTPKEHLRMVIAIDRQKAVRLAT